MGTEAAPGVVLCMRGLFGRSAVQAVPRGRILLPSFHGSFPKCRSVVCSTVISSLTPGSTLLSGIPRV